MGSRRADICFIQLKSFRIVDNFHYSRDFCVKPKVIILIISDCLFSPNRSLQSPSVCSSWYNLSWQGQRGRWTADGSFALFCGSELGRGTSCQGLSVCPLSLQASSLYLVSKSPDWISAEPGQLLVILVNGDDSPLGAGTQGVYKITWWETFLPPHCMLDLQDPRVGSLPTSQQHNQGNVGTFLFLKCSSLSPESLHMKSHGKEKQICGQWFCLCFCLSFWTFLCF